MCLSRSRFHLSSVGLCGKKVLQKAKKLFKVSLLSLSKDSLVNFLGKTSRISASSFPSSSVICVKIFKHGPYFPPRTGYDSVSTSASFSFEQTNTRSTSGKAKLTSQFWTLCLALSRLYLSFVGLWKNTARLR